MRLDVEVKVGVVGGQVDPPHAAEEVADGRLARIPFEQARGVAGSGDADFLGADLEHVWEVGALVERGGFGGLFFQELKKVEGEPVRWKLNWSNSNMKWLYSSYIFFNLINLVISLVYQA